MFNLLPSSFPSEPVTEVSKCNMATPYNGRINIPVLGRISTPLEKNKGRNSCKKARLSRVPTGLQALTQQFYKPLL